MSTIINATTTNGVVIQPDNSGSLVLQTNSGTTALTIDTSQNVGIGTTSPSFKLQANSNGSQLLLDNSSAGQFTQINWANTGSTKANAYWDNTNTQFLFGTDVSAPLAFKTNASERMRIDSNGNFSAVIPSGSTIYPAFWCRAWVNFNGTGTVAIRASGNVTSITDGGVGIYSLNLTTSMPDANYSTIITAGSNSANSFESNVNPSSTTSTVNINTHDYGNTYSDNSLICVAVFR